MLCLLPHNLTLFFFRSLYEQSASLRQRQAGRCRKIERLGRRQTSIRRRQTRGRRKSPSRSSETPSGGLHQGCRGLPQGCRPCGGSTGRHQGSARLEGEGGRRVEGEGGRRHHAAASGSLSAQQSRQDEALPGLHKGLESNEKFCTGYERAHELILLAADHPKEPPCGCPMVGNPIHPLQEMRDGLAQHQKLCAAHKNEVGRTTPTRFSSKATTLSSPLAHSCSSAFSPTFI